MNSFLMKPHMGSQGGADLRF